MTGYYFGVIDWFVTGFVLNFVKAAEFSFSFLRFQSLADQVVVLELVDLIDRRLNFWFITMTMDFIVGLERHSFLWSWCFMDFIDSKVTFGNPKATVKIWSRFIVDLINFKIT